ncbi:hypothetical protein HOY82DRAFT_614469 [Tuber indicum]|nr:hypothetical protein HOY82DRAFT_614469 [Tuber indicum]
MPPITPTQTTQLLGLVAHADTTATLLCTKAYSNAQGIGSRAKPFWDAALAEQRSVHRISELVMAGRMSYAEGKWAIMKSLVGLGLLDDGIDGMGEGVTREVPEAVIENAGPQIAAGRAYWIACCDYRNEHLTNG